MAIYFRHEQIKARLHDRGRSLRGIARELDVLPSTVTIVSQGLRRSRRIEAAIAAAFETTPEALFPDRYAQTEVAMPS